jgi:hypothetical protein
MSGSLRTYLNLLHSLCGDDALKNVMFVTTMWNKVRDEDQGEALRHEQQLVDEFWAPMVAKGACVAQFDGSSDAAYALVWQMSGKKGVILDIQKEYVERSLEVRHTSAGMKLTEKLREDKEKYTVRLSELDTQLAGLAGSSDKVRIQELQRQKKEVQAMLGLTITPLARKLKASSILSAPSLRSTTEDVKDENVHLADN